MSTVIKIENLSKQYRLGLIGTNTLKGDIQRWWYTMRGLPDPTLMIGQENSLDGSKKDYGLDEYIWALKNINLEVQQGEVLGIIGKNGAGKSTLLKILSRVTAPTTGNFKVKGRIASLLEVGTGFHPELTGRENIFLNGAILGMKKVEISTKLDEIVDFAGIAKYIDTPVKRYSSGMYVRLAFAVAAHLDPEILIVDEVLAVGDAEFQKKAIGKMQNVSHEKGRTILFVSHNLTAIKNLCTKGIIIENGKLIYQENNLDKLISKYLSKNNSNYNKTKSWENFDSAPGNKCLKLTLASIEVKNMNNYIISLEDNILIRFEFWSLKPGLNISISIEVFTVDYECVFKSTSNQIITRIGNYISSIMIPANFLNDNIYMIDFYFIKDDNLIEFEYKNILQLEISETKRRYNWIGKWLGTTRPNFTFTIYE